MCGTEMTISDFFDVESVFNKYADEVYRLAFVRTRNRYDSDDILQEVFLRYMKVCKKMESEEHVKATLLRITVNYSNSFKNSAHNKRDTQLDEDIPYTDKINDGSVLEKVLALPDKYRTVIHLYYYCGYSVNEISKITGNNPATVKTHMKRARNLLKIDLEEEL